MQSLNLPSVTCFSKQHHQMGTVCSHAQGYEDVLIWTVTVSKPIITLRTLCFANMDGSFLLRLCFKHWFNYISHILRYCALIFKKYKISDYDFFRFMGYLEVCYLISNISWFGAKSYFSGFTFWFKYTVASKHILCGFNYLKYTEDLCNVWIWPCCHVLHELESLHSYVVVCMYFKCEHFYSKKLLIINNVTS